MKSEAAGVLYIFDSECPDCTDQFRSFLFCPVVFPHNPPIHWAKTVSLEFERQLGDIPLRRYLVKRQNKDGKSARPLPWPIWLPPDYEEPDNMSPTLEHDEKSDSTVPRNEQKMAH